MYETVFSDCCNYDVKYRGRLKSALRSTAHFWMPTILDTRIQRLFHGSRLKLTLGTKELIINN